MVMETRKKLWEHGGMEKIHGNEITTRKKGYMPQTDRGSASFTIFLPGHGLVHPKIILSSSLTTMQKLIGICIKSQENLGVTGPHPLGAGIRR